MKPLAFLAAVAVTGAVCFAGQTAAAQQAVEKVFCNTDKPDLCPAGATALNLGHVSTWQERQDIGMKDEACQYTTSSGATGPMFVTRDSVQPGGGFGVDMITIMCAEGRQ
jgi:hypothetical protein